MNPEDRIRMLLSLSDAEHEEAQAKYLRRLQEPFIYRGRPEPSMSPMMSEEEIGYEVPYGAHPGQNPPLPYDFKGM